MDPELNPNFIWGPILIPNCDKNQLPSELSGVFEFLNQDQTQGCSTKKKNQTEGCWAPYGMWMIF